MIYITNQIILIDVAFKNWQLWWLYFQKHPKNVNILWISFSLVTISVTCLRLTPHTCNICVLWNTHTHTQMPKKYILKVLYPFWGDKLSIRFHHILLGQLHQENDSGHRINYACPWPKTRHWAEGDSMYTHTHIHTHEEEEDLIDVAHQFILLPKKFIRLII